MAYQDLFYENNHNFYSGTNKVLSTTNSTSITTGALTVNGGVGITKDLYVGGSINSSSVGNVPTFTVTPFNFLIQGAVISGHLTGNFIKIKYGDTYRIDMCINQLLQLSSGDTDYMLSELGAVPVEFRPTTTDIYIMISVTNNGNKSWGLLQITTGGDLTIYNTNTVFGAEGYNGVNKQTISYFI